jgi:AraC-like DNA-binding protein
LNIEAYSDSYKNPGYINIRNGRISKGEFLNCNQYDQLIPTNLKGSPYTYFIDRDFLLLFVNGTLLTFQIKPYRFTPTASVRSISNDLIGTYDGLFNYSLEKDFDLPGYTNGKIIQLTNGLAICWDGLYIKNGDLSFNYFDPEIYEVQYEGKNLGYARDLLEIEENKWLLFSTSGLYYIDHKLKSVKTILLTNNNAEPKYSFKNSGFTIIYTAHVVYQLNQAELSLTKLFESKSAIKDLFTENNWLFYVLYADKLQEINLRDSTSRILMDGYNDAHTLTNFHHQFLISTNFGLHVYSLITNKGYYSFIENEFNKYAAYVENNIVRLGTVNGFYELNQDALNSIYFIRDYDNDKKQKVSLLKTNDILKGCLILLLFSFIPIHFFYKSFFIKQKNKFISALELSIEEKIKAYVLSNLPSITLKKIQKEFDIDQNSLYQIFNEIKPGEFIRQQRLILVRKMRKDNKSEEEISKATGFSLSYLKKI